MRKAITNLTPKNAWNQYVSTSEEIFISNYMAESKPITDIKKMCRAYAQELPIIFEYEKILFSDKQLEELEKLLTDHLENYIASKGGIDKLELLTEEELDEMTTITHNISMNLLADKFGVTREEISKALRDDK